MKKTLWSFVLVGALILSNLSFAEEKPASAKPAATEREGFNVFKAMRKGGRGLCNIATSPFEIPNQMVKEAKRHNSVGGAVAGYLTGIPVGCGWMLYRCGTGIWDFLSSPVPTPTYE